MTYDQSFHKGLGLTLTFELHPRSGGLIPPTLPPSRSDSSASKMAASRKGFDGGMKRAALWLAKQRETADHAFSWWMEMVGAGGG